MYYFLCCQLSRFEGNKDAKIIGIVLKTVQYLGLVENIYVKTACYKYFETKSNSNPDTYPQNS